MGTTLQHIVGYQLNSAYETYLRVIVDDEAWVGLLMNKKAKL